MRLQTRAYRNYSHHQKPRAARDTLLTDAENDFGALVPIHKGRLVEQESFQAAAEKVKVFGIELLDIRFKRINYNESVRPKIYDRMISERRQLA